MAHPLMTVLKTGHAGAVQLLRYIYMALLVLAVVTFGAVQSLPEGICATGFFAVAVLACLFCGEAAATRSMFRTGLAVMIVLLGWAFLQTVDAGPGSPLGNSAWRVLADYGFEAGHYISVAPAETRAQMIALALPFAVFLAGLALFHDDNSARYLLSFLAIWGGVAGFAGLVQFLAFPDTLFFVEKRFYLDSLTGFFVNRNTAGTFYGVLSLLQFSMLWQLGRTVDWGRTFSRIVSGGKAGTRFAEWKLVRYLLLYVLCTCALLLTKSRGGIGATFLGYAVLLPVLLADRYKANPMVHGFTVSQSSGWPRLLRIAGSLAVIAVLGVVFGGRVALRVASVNSSEDSRFCIYPGEMRAVFDNWSKGTGFGTFKEFFSTYRDPACGTYGTWDLAHNVYLEGALGLGVVFFAAAFIVIGALVRAHLAGLQARRALRVYPAAGLCAVIVTAAHSFVDFSVQMPGFAVTLAALLAGTVTISLGRGSAPARAAGSLVPPRVAAPQNAPA